ncbi:MAG: hypothetical protein S4CHLAM6_02470 [Chlamydiae bacterium]|nr:hypothetical protein [Chlamydiota bacterium]
MNTDTHKKLCRNCDGYVHVYEMKCPYCGAAISDFPEESPEPELAQGSLSDTMQKQNEDLISDNSFQPPYQNYGLEQGGAALQQPSKLDSGEKDSADVENPLASLLLLIPGSVLFLLGLTVALFSTDGVLTFQFKSKFWFVYLVGSLPLLYLGYKSLFSKNVTEPSINDHSYTNPLER